MSIVEVPQYSEEWDDHTLSMWLLTNAYSLDIDDEDVQRIGISQIKNGEQIERATTTQLTAEWGLSDEMCEKIRNIIVRQPPPPQLKGATSRHRSATDADFAEFTLSAPTGSPQNGPIHQRQLSRKHRIRNKLSPNPQNNPSPIMFPATPISPTLGPRSLGQPVPPSSGKCTLRLHIKNHLFMSRLCYPRWWIENGDCKQLPNAVEFKDSIDLHLEGYPGECLNGLLSYVIYDQPYLPSEVFNSNLASLIINSEKSSAMAALFPPEVLPPPFGTIFPKCFVNSTVRREQENDENRSVAGNPEEETPLQTRVIIMWSVKIPKDPQLTRVATQRRLDLTQEHSRRQSDASDMSFESLDNINRFSVTFVQDTEDLSLNPDLFQEIMDTNGAIAELEQSRATNESYEAMATMGNGPVCDLTVRFEDIMVDTNTVLPDGQDLFGRSPSQRVKPVNDHMVNLEDVMSMLQPRMFLRRSSSYHRENPPTGANLPRPPPPRLRSISETPEPPRRKASSGEQLERISVEVPTPGDAYKNVSPLFSPRRRRGSHEPVLSIAQGDRVQLENGKRGQVKVICQHKAWGPGTWYCIRLTEPRGNNDGSWKGIRAFFCPARYGVMVQKRSITQKLNEASFDFMEEEIRTDTEHANQVRRCDSLIKIQQKWNSMKNEPYAPIVFREFAEIVKESEANMTRSELREVFNRIDKGGTGRISYETFSDWYEKRQQEKMMQQREEDSREREAKVQEYREKQIKGVGSAPRTVIVRNKVPPLEEHEGYSFIQEAIGLQEDGKWKAAIKMYDIGISTLEVNLIQIDRGLEKRKWREKLDEFRHKRSRCQREVAHAKRKKQLAARDKMRKKHAKQRAKEENKKIEKEIQEAFREAAGTPTGGIHDDLAGLFGDDEKKEASGSESEQESDEDTSAPAKPTHMRRSTRRLLPTPTDRTESKEKKKPKKETKLSQQDQELQDRIAGHVVDDVSNISFKDVMGLENVKLALYESIILPNIRPDLFKNITKPTTGLLLFGPPGNGKTMIAKCVAAECDATFFSISAAAITSKWVGEAERIMRTLFQVARQRQPSIIFIDEIDSLLTARGGSNEHESSRRIKTEFLIQFDGVHDSSEASANVVVIGATNLPQQLDDAVLRRFPKRIMVPNPDADARFGLMRLLMSKHRHALHSPDYHELSEMTDGYSCSDLSMLCQDVVMGPIRELRGSVVSAAAEDIPPISRRHFAQSIQNIRASTPASSLRMYDDWNDRYGSSLFLTVDVLPENMRSVVIVSDDENEDAGET